MTFRFGISENSCWNKNQHPRGTLCANFQEKRTTLTFCTNLPKNGSWGRNFKNLSPDSESTPQRYHERQFSVKMDNFEFFGLNLGCPKTSNILILITLRVLQRAGWRWVELGGTEWSWVEVDGVEVARFSNIHYIAPCYFGKSFYFFKV